MNTEKGLPHGYDFGKGKIRLLEPMLAVGLFIWGLIAYVL